MNTSLAPISQRIWDMKYRLKGPDGHVIDKTVEDTWRRVATALAALEDEPEAWAERFYEVLDGFAFLPAGRILAGAGAERDVTLFNCFVMGAIADDMAGIFENLKEAALTMQKGGGIGHDFSTLRPRGAPVKGVGADASGPISFMNVWDAMCRTIMSAGYRRGAMMGTLRCDHPDIEAFIDAKREPGALRMFNLSVLVTDAFMDAIKEDRPWELAFAGVTYKTVRARELWDRVMRATYEYAEPGVIFIDRVNQRNNLRYCETIYTSNPCVTAETWVQTTDGPRQVRELVGRSFTALVNGRARPSGAQGFFPTGHKPVIRLVTRHGHDLRLTADHLVRRVIRQTRNRTEHDWINAGDLAVGDRVVLHDHRPRVGWPGPHGSDEGYLLGLLIGDGVLKEDKAVLSAWPGALAVGGGFERPGVTGVMDRAFAAALTLPHRADFGGWVKIAGRGEFRMALVAIDRLARDLGLSRGNKTITPAIEQCSSEFCRGFLRGLFDADGSVQGTQKKGVSIRLAQSNEVLLTAVQRMLLRLGIHSRVYKNRRPAGPRILPDGKGGKRVYQCSADHELVIAGENLEQFADLVGFSDHDKAARLARLRAGYKRRLNQARFEVEIESVCEDGSADVFDVQIPGANAFDANGIYIHNCGEQLLPPYGACLLGSVNLAALVRRPFQPDAALDLERLERTARTAVRMLDNAIDVSHYPLPEQAAEARAKRRIGLGVTGLADALIMCRARYGSRDAMALVETWMARLRRAAYAASIELAAEKGAFPLFDAEPYLAGETVADLDEDLREGIRAKGIRNGLLTTVAPTGTISLLADNVSSGIEPVFSFTHRRNLLTPDGATHSEEVVDHAYRLYRQSFPDADPPDYFVDAQKLSPIDHLSMQATAQRFIDSSISKTINCPEQISFDDFKSIYMQAYDMGCKGCATYRPNEITGAVLEAPGADAAAEPELPLAAPPPRPADEYEAGVVYMTQPLERPGELPGTTYKVRWPESDHAIYITINDIVQDGRRRPFEIFINSKNMEHYAWTLGLTRMISAVFRRGGDVSFVVDELKAVFDPRGGQWIAGKYVPSLLAAIGGVIEQHMINIGFLPRPADDAGRQLKAVGDDSPRPRGCPRCGERAMVHLEGCDTCAACNYSRCA